MECNIGMMQYFISFGNALLCRYIYFGRLVKISANIAFLLYKEYTIYNISANDRIHK